MKIRVIFTIITLVTLLFLQTNIIVTAQNRQIDNSDGLEMNYRGIQNATIDLGNTEVGGSGGFTNYENDHDNGLGNGGTPANPTDTNSPDEDEETSGNTSNTNNCDKPEFIYCSQVNTNHLGWTAPANAISYDILILLINSTTETIVDDDEILNHPTNSYVLKDIALPFPQVTYIFDGSYLQIEEDYNIQIQITPNFSQTCASYDDITLSGTYAYNIGECVTNPDGSEHFGPYPVAEHNPPGGGEGAKGFAVIETDTDTKRGYQNTLPNSTLQITPNPVQNRATITVDLPNTNPLSINIYNANGQHIQEIATTNQMTKGMHHFNYETNHLPAGIYYCHVQSGEQFITKKIVKMD